MSTRGEMPEQSLNQPKGFRLLGVLRKFVLFGTGNTGVSEGISKEVRDTAFPEGGITLVHGIFPFDGSIQSHRINTQHLHL